MTISIDQTLFWTVLSALIAYDFFTATLGRLLNRRSNCMAAYDQGFGPRGMVVKSRDNIGEPKPEQSSAKQQ